MMTKISGELDLSQIPPEQFDPNQELRVAVVREGVVLGSTTLAPGKIKQALPFEVAFDPPLLPGGRLPCPVRLIVGPDVTDRELLGLESVSMEIDLLKPQEGQAKAKAAALAVASVKVGRLTIAPEIYHCWLVCCRTYTIRGRVVCRHWHYDPLTGRWVFCDAPVPGATVEAYDVDCFLWWCRRDLIKSAVTDVHGNFTMRFRWCCVNWHPWLERDWALDADLYARIQEMLASANIPLPHIPPGPDPDPLFLQQLVANAAGSSAPRLGASLDIPGIIDAPVSAQALQALLPRSQELAALHVWPWWNRHDCAPDVVFRVTQFCGDRFNVIYSETNAQTRWDIPTTLNVTLLANGRACCLPVCRDPECPECIKLTWVGCTPADQIGTTAGPPDLRGYAHAGPLATDPHGDNPFYGALRIRGGVGWDVDYFKVQVSKNGGAWTDLAVPAFDGFSRSYWDGSNFVPALAPAFTPTVKNGKTVMVSRRHYEDLHPAIPRFGGAVLWNDYDTLFYFNTLASPALTPDALYQLRFVGYAADAADNLIAASERILPTCGKDSAEAVYIRIDNQGKIHPVPTPVHPCTPIHHCTNEPDCYIRKVCVNDPFTGACKEIKACDIVRLEDSDTVTIHFSATCPPTPEDGHLGGYWLNAEYGVSQSLAIVPGVGTLAPDPTPETGPDYTAALTQGAPRPHWYGGDYKVTIKATDFPECCAYLLRLHAWKRTTDGCSDPRWTHSNDFELAFTVLRTRMCPDICPE